MRWQNMRVGMALFTTLMDPANSISWKYLAMTSIQSQRRIDSMGSTRFDPDAYRDYATSTATKSAADYTSSTLKKDFDPKLIKVRESVASAINPHPTPIIVGLDVTGSMGRVLEACRRGLGT